MLKTNLEEVKDNIQTTCQNANRNIEDVTLICVSKTKPKEMIEELYEGGMRDFGENKVQELRDKYEALPKDITWHMIGHLQRNKVKYIAPFISLIHSVDSERLAKTISDEAIKNNRTIDILLEVNVAKEESKFGFDIDELSEKIEIISKYPNISIKGLMTIAPYVPNPEENRIFFAKLYQLCVDINEKNLDNVKMSELSMGMSNDYEVAIEEGSTMVRVGTSIFGERIYKKL